MAHDAIVIGGSFAGLAAATYIARARRDVRVIDTGLPRNRFAEHSHGFLGRDGYAPGDILAEARAQIAAYPSVSFSNAAATGAIRTEDGFAVTLSSGETLEAARLVLAYGICDELPDVPGLAERWGNTVIHCPYCHGYEFAGRRLGVLVTGPMSVHQAALVSEWGPVTLYLNGGPELDADTMAELDRRCIPVEPAPIVAVRGAGKGMSEIEFKDGRTAGLDALYVGPMAHHNSDIARQLGCEMETVPWGEMIRTDFMQATTVPNVFAAGDIARGAHSVTWAASDGVMAGTALHRSLVF